MAMAKYGVYVVMTSAIIGLALSFIMRDWVILERYGGSNDRRKAKRSKAKGDASWLSDSETDTTPETMAMQLLTLSDTGAELICSTPPADEETGQLILPERDPCRVQVVYSDRERCYVKFLKEAA